MKKILPPQLATQAGLIPGVMDNKSAEQCYKYNLYKK